MHSVAIAEFHGVLYRFIDKFKEKKKRKINYVVDVRVPPNVGTKKTKATQRRKGGTSKEILAPTPIFSHLRQIFKKILRMGLKSRLKT